jgi:hypothetical protein
MGIQSAFFNILWGKKSVFSEKLFWVKKIYLSKLVRVNRIRFSFKPERVVLLSDNSLGL